MSGHSKWAQIKRAKGANDVKRGQIFGKLSKEITVAVRVGNSGDPNFNPRLRAAITEARAESMPNDKIENAIKKGTGEVEGAASIEEIVYEGYADGGVAVLIETATDNKNRSAAEIRSIFNKNNGNLGGAGAVAWMFHRKAYFLTESDVTEEAVFEATIEAGAEDIQRMDDGVEIFAPVDKFDAIHKALEKNSLKVQTAKLIFVPENNVAISDEKTAYSVLRLIEKLEENDDVQKVYANYDIPDELIEKISAEQ